jgi:hypothetical protein
MGSGDCASPNLQGGSRVESREFQLAYETLDMETPRQSTKSIGACKWGMISETWGLLLVLLAPLIVIAR